MKSTRLLIITFKNRISNEEIPLFRGAIINNFGNSISELFHNHQNEKLRYAYPLIQYKRINGNAAILGIDEGADVLEQLTVCNNFICQLGCRRVKMEINSVKSEQIFISLSDNPQRYCIQKWLPLNSENYQKYLKVEGLAERIEMLNKILIGNILSFTKGINIHIHSPLTCKLTKLEDSIPVSYKGVELKSFNAEFQANIILPDFIGLGKSSSINNGTINHIK
ncbi:CRISPR-associated endonuclease Cas6 [Bacteroides salyersiae]|mgnify:FL=1|uniref:CRISPR-associated endonuclease Cas6 n=1 Tax=Bacteroides salyersiae TaxID=291644 RepID=UPI0034A3A202